MTAMFVTGGSGFIGRQLLRDLVAGGHAVTALEHRTPIDVPGVTKVSGSLESATELAAVLEKSQVVFHSAALLDPVDNARAADAINHRATVALAQAAAAAGVESFVFLSSISAVGFFANAGLMDERFPCAPASNYGRSKRDAELALLSGGFGPMRLVIIRPPTVYGPEEGRNFLALTRAVAKRRVFIPGSGGNRMSFCHVENLTHAAIALGLHDEARGIVHVADAPPVTFLEVIEAIRAALGQRGVLPRLPLPLAEALARAMAAAWSITGRTPPLSPRRLRTLTADCALDTGKCAALGIEPRVEFASAVGKTVAAYRAAGLLRDA